MLRLHGIEVFLAESLGALILKSLKVPKEWLGLCSFWVFIRNLLLSYLVEIKFLLSKKAPSLEVVGFD